MHKTPEITRLIHENLWTILSFAFGQPVIAKLIDVRFKGEWKYLNKTIFERAEVRADRALLEMSTQIRVLDDQEGISDHLRQTQNDLVLGEVTQSDGTKTPLYLRDMTNKVMHAALFRWDLSAQEHPKIICLPKDGDRWKEATIDVIPLMSFIGQLMH